MEESPTSNDLYQKLLETSRTKMKLGDGWASIVAYLEKQQADKETIRRIVQQLDAEKKEESQREAPLRREKEKKALLLNGVYFTVIGALVLAGGLFTLNLGLSRGVLFFLPLGIMFFGAILFLRGIVAFVQSARK